MGRDTGDWGRAFKRVCGYSQETRSDVSPGPRPSNVKRLFLLNDASQSDKTNERYHAGERHYLNEDGEHASYPHDDIPTH